MKRWIALTAALMMIGVLVAAPASADWETPESPETFEEISDERFLREIVSWWNDVFRDMDKTNLNTVSRLPVFFESARLCLEEIRNRYEAGRIDASILESLLDPVFDQALRIGEVGMDILDQSYRDGKIDAETFLSERRKVIGLKQELAETLIAKLDLSRQDGMMDAVETFERSLEVLDDLMEDWKETYDILEELLTDEEIPVELFLREAGKASDGVFWVLDRYAGIASDYHDAGEMEEEEYLEVLKELIEERREWIQVLTETTAGLLQDSVLTKNEEDAVSAYLLSKTSVLVEEFNIWLDAMHDAGKVDDISYGILKIWMEELEGMITQMFEQAPEGQLAIA
jgi:hypothetical protein